jgi:penicillin-binding protein 1A
VYATLVDRFGYFMDDTMDTTPVTVTDADGSQHSINSYLNRSTATLQEALNVSDNSAAYRACTMAGIENVAEVGRACGIQSEIELNPIVSIGGQSVGFTPIDLATAYATLANKGYAHDTWCVRQITDTMGNQIYEHEDTADNSRQAIDPNTAAIMDASLVEVANTASWIDISFAKRGGWTVGAKTGGSDWYADAWCCATDGTRAMAAWIGGRDAKQQQDGDEDAVWLIDQALWAVAQGDPKENVFPVPEKKIRVPEVEDGTSWEW